MLKGSKPLFLVNISKLSIFALHDKFCQTNGFSPRSLQSWLNMNKIHQSVVSYLTLKASTQKNIHFSRLLTETKNDQHNYIDYRVRSKTPKKIFQFLIKFKNNGKNSFSMKNQWRDEICFSPRQILIPYIFLLPKSL